MRTLRLEDLSKALDGLSKKTLREQKQAVGKAMARAIPRLVAASPVDTGLYAQSWDFTVDEKSAIIGNYAPYASVIEFGARPYSAPIDPLLAWAKRVLSDPSQPPDYSEKVRALAWGTWRKIRARGFAPHHILENQIPLIIADIKKELNL